MPKQLSAMLRTTDGKRRIGDGEPAVASVYDSTDLHEIGKEESRLASPQDDLIEFRAPQ